MVEQESTGAWEEWTLTPQSQEELLALTRMLRRSQGIFALAFAHCNAVKLRERLVRALRDTLAPVGVTIHEVKLTAKTRNLPAVLAATKGDGDPLFIYGLEITMPSIAPEWAQAQLNERRGLYQKLSRPLVFWLPEYTLQLVARGAPDFWAWRSGVYEFAPPPTKQKSPLVQVVWETAEEADLHLLRKLLLSSEHLRHPIITIEIQHAGLALDAWSRFQFVLHNVGYGPARNLTISITGDQFEGQVTATRQIATLLAGRKRIDWLDIRPRSYGNSVPLQVSVEYEDQVGKAYINDLSIYVPVAQIETTRDTGQVVHITIVGGAVIFGDVTVVDGDFVGRERDIISIDVDQHAQEVRVEIDSLRRQLAEARANLQLIRERKSGYVMQTSIPLDLIKQERNLRKQIAKMEAELIQL